MQRNVKSIFLVGTLAVFYAGSAAGKLNYLVVPALSSDIRLSHQVKKNVNGSNVINIVGARGEYEPAAIILSSSKNSVEIKFSMSDLKSGSSIIKSHNISLRVVKEWYQASGAWRSHYTKSKKDSILVPELLLNDDSLISVDHATKHNQLRLGSYSSHRYIGISQSEIPDKRIIYTNDELPVSDANVLLPISIQEGQLKKMWITFYVPNEAKPGIYSGVLDIKSNDSEVSIPVTVEVLDFDLKRPILEYSVYYRGKLGFGFGSVSSEYKNTIQLEAELRNIYEHGIARPVVFQLNRNPQDSPKISFNQQLKYLDKYLAIMKSIGFDMSKLYLLKTPGNPTRPSDLLRLRSLVRNLVDVIKRYGVQELYLYGEDEAKGERLLSQRKAWNVVRSEGVKIFAATSYPDYRKMVDLMDVIVLHGPLRAQEAEFVHKNKKRIFSYHNPQSGAENPVIFRRNYGLALWQAGYDGAMVYAYQHAGATGSIWNDFDSKPTRDLNLTYPTVDGVIDTLAWEGLREGIDDVRYITTLESLLSDADNELKEDDKEFVKKFIRRLKKSNLRNLDDTRSEIIKYIRLLSKKKS